MPGAGCHRLGQCAEAVDDAESNLSSALRLDGRNFGVTNVSLPPNDPKRSNSHQPKADGSYTKTSDVQGFGYFDLSFVLQFWTWMHTFLC